MFQICQGSQDSCSFELVLQKICHKRVCAVSLKTFLFAGHDHSNSQLQKKHYDKFICMLVYLSSVPKNSRKTILSAFILCVVFTTLQVNPNTELPLVTS